MRFDWKAAASGVLAGLLAGGGLGFWAATRSEGRHDTARLVRKFSSRLDLSAEQQARLRTILDAKREKVRALREQTRPRFDEIRAETRAEIQAILTPSQLPEFEKMHQEWEAELARRRARAEPPR